MATLYSQAWHSRKFIGHSASFLVKIEISSNCYSAVITDMSSVWCEKITPEEIEAVSQRYNTGLEIPTPVLLKHVASAFLKGRESDAIISINNNDQSELRVVINEMNIPEVPLKWEFKFTLCTEPHLLKDLLILPLLSLLSEYNERQTQLMQIVNEKDTEIKEYKLAGAVLPKNRRKYETETFSKTNFENIICSKSYHAGDITNILAADCGTVFTKLHEDVLYTHASTNSWSPFQLDTSVTNNNNNNNNVITTELITQSPNTNTSNTLDSDSSSTNNNSSTTSTNGTSSTSGDTGKDRAAKNKIEEMERREIVEKRLAQLPPGMSGGYKAKKKKTTL